MLLLPPRIGVPRKGRAAHNHLKNLKKKKEEEKNKKEVTVPSAQEPKAKGKLPRRCLAGKPCAAIRVLAKDGES